jgi:16S rRNA (guanine1207-N2)-methyltransferase
MEHRIGVNILGHDLFFKTDEHCFSPRSIDKGTLVLLSAVSLRQGQKILDLGCGYGVVGIAAAKIAGAQNVTMSDIDENVLGLAKENAVSNGVSGVKVIKSDGFINLDETGFDLILSNPPYHADFRVPKMFIEKGFNRPN